MSIRQIRADVVCELRKPFLRRKLSVVKQIRGETLASRGRRRRASNHAKVRWRIRVRFHAHFFASQIQKNESKAEGF